MSANIIPVFFNQVQLSVQPDDVHTYLMPTSQVAIGYDCSVSTIRRHLQEHKDELNEGEHYISSLVQNLNARGKAANLRHKQTYWTKLGVIYLGFFIKSERAKQFRKFAADLILNEMEKKPKRKALGKGLELPETMKEVITNPDQLMTLNYLRGRVRSLDTMVAFRSREIMPEPVAFMPNPDYIDDLHAKLFGNKKEIPLYRKKDLYIAVLKFLDTGIKPVIRFMCETPHGEK